MNGYHVLRKVFWVGCCCVPFFVVEEGTDQGHWEMLWTVTSSDALRPKKSRTWFPKFPINLCRTWLLGECHQYAFPPLLPGPGSQCITSSSGLAPKRPHLLPWSLPLAARGCAGEDYLGIFIYLFLRARSELNIFKRVSNCPSVSIFTGRNCYAFTAIEIGLCSLLKFFEGRTLLAVFHVKGNNDKVWLQGAKIWTHCCML